MILALAGRPARPRGCCAKLDAVRRIHCRLMKQIMVIEQQLCVEAVASFACHNAEGIHAGTAQEESPCMGF